MSEVSAPVTLIAAMSPAAGGGSGDDGPARAREDGRVPFYDDEGEPLTETDLRYLGGKRFILLTPFVWVDPRDGARHAVPSGATEGAGAGAELAAGTTEGAGGHPAPTWTTDLASVPPFLWGLVASYGRQTLPAILHDRLTEDVRRSPAADRVRLQEAADDDLLVALREAGVPDARSRIMWVAVRLVGYVRNAPPLAAGVIAQLVASVALIVAAVVLAVLATPWWLVAIALPALAAIAWGRRTRLMLTASYAGALYAPVLVAAAVSSGVEYVLSLAVWLASGLRGAPPRPGPQVSRR